MDSERLLERAHEAAEHAYAPYSGFRVGAALLGDDGSIHVGCNVENASYGLTICAERSALAAAVARGVRRFRMLALSTEGEEAASPCGACRQVLAEFGLDLPIVSGTTSGDRRRWELRELLPAPFLRDAVEDAGRG